MIYHFEMRGRLRLRAFKPLAVLLDEDDAGGSG